MTALAGAARLIASWIRPPPPVCSETAEGATVKPRKLGWKPGVTVSESVPLLSQGVKSMRFVVGMVVGPAVDLTLTATVAWALEPYQLPEASRVAVPLALSRRKMKLLVLFTMLLKRTTMPVGGVGRPLKPTRM